MWDELQDGQIHSPTEDDRQTHGSQAQEYSGATVQASVGVRISEKVAMRNPVKPFADGFVADWILAERVDGEFLDHTAIGV